ncbi:MAG TPA: class I SAM-dependent methyltransferase [Kofleriaceae bacterium]|nr:class I SAM-dependent methyltransferase [Kofleriaceae bacterium]
MDRAIEPELMIDPDQVEAYSDADFSDANDSHVSAFDRYFPDAPDRADVLDLCCGPGDVTLRFARAHPGWNIHGIDGSRAMLERADSASRRMSIDRARWVEATLPDCALPLPTYHILLCTGALHHFHRPVDLWSTIRRAARPGSLVFVVDFFRPASTKRARQLVERHAAGAPPVLQQDFYNSLCAAFTPDEVRKQLDEQGLDRLVIECVSDRHQIVAGRIPGCGEP